MVLNIVKNVSTLIGTSEKALILLCSLFVTYPMAWFYRYFLRFKSIKTKLYYFVICGLFLSVLNYGVNTYHSIIAVLFTYVTLKILPPSKYNVIVNFVFHMSYLLIGYKMNESDDYDLTWTMAHCVLTLRLIGLSFDLWDGTKDPEKLSKSFKKSALKEHPSLLQIFAFVFFPSSYLIGPQFSMDRLTNFVDNTLGEPNESSAVKVGLKRGSIGIIYLFIYQLGCYFLPFKYFLSQDYLNSGIIKKHILLAPLTKIFIAKYVACWLFTEGACITFGIAYNGKDNKDEHLWDGCRNVDLGILEGLTKYGQYVECFNINTNAWVAQYIYKRMAFLGNRHISRATTVFFLAVWHGLKSGYYAAFFMQFIIMIMEKDLDVILSNSQMFNSISQNKYFKMLTLIPMKLYSHIYLGWAIVAFELLDYEKYWPIYRSLYFSGFLIFIPYMFLYRPIIKQILKPEKLRRED